MTDLFNNLIPFYYSDAEHMAMHKMSCYFMILTMFDMIQNSVRTGLQKLLFFTHAISLINPCYQILPEGENLTIHCDLELFGRRCRQACSRRSPLPMSAVPTATAARRWT